MRFLRGGLTWSWACGLGLVMCSVPAGSGQESAAAARVRETPSGSVEGNVLDDATNLPVRFAVIRLVPEPADLEAATSTALPKDGERRPERELASVQGASGMDGSFHLRGVPAGEYIIEAVQFGYVVPGESVIRNLNSTADQLKGAAAALPHVRVNAGGVAQVQLRVHRGGTVTGRVVFGDGSPVIGAMVSCEPVKPVVLPPDARFRTISPLQGILQALVAPRGDGRRDRGGDDQGNYRVSGLAPGRYIVGVALALDHSSGHVAYRGGEGAVTSGREHMYPELMVAYHPGVFDRQRAKVIEIRSSEVVEGADITVAPEGVHAIRGKIAAGEDGHAPTAAMVRLKQDGSDDQGRFVEIEEDGSFQFDYVPPGKYVVAVIASDQVEAGTEDPARPGGFTFYRAVKLPVQVGEHDVNVPEIRLTALRPGEQPDYAIF